MVRPGELRETDAIAATFGVKAAELCEFTWMCTDLGYSVPQSWLVPTSLMDPAVMESHMPAPRRYAPLPDVDDPPTGWHAARQRFATLAETVLNGLPDRCGRLLRSSVLWPTAHPRPPGVDITVAADAADRAESLFGGVHKAYADLCRRRWGDDTPIRFGLILSDLATSVFQGTAYVTASRVGVELGADGVEPAHADSPQALAASGLVGLAVATTLFQQLIQLAATTGDDPAVEIEFLLDDATRLVPTQRRLLHRVPGGPAPFHSPARFHGPVIDLRAAPRHRSLLVRALTGGPGAGVIVPVSRSAVLDLFALLWTFDQEPQMPRPGAVILTYGAASPAGMATHLRWLVSALLPSTPVYYAPTRSIPTGHDRALISSDGVRLVYGSER